MPNIKYKSDAQARRARLSQIAKYQKENMVRYTLRINKNSYPQVIEKLNSLENKTDYIRDLILKDLNENKQN